MGYGNTEMKVGAYINVWRKRITTVLTSEWQSCTEIGLASNLGSARAGSVLSRLHELNMVEMTTQQRKTGAGLQSLYRLKSNKERVL